MTPEPRCFFMSQPQKAVREHLHAELRRIGLVKQLGRRALFPPLNWHQSLSDRFEDDPELIERLLSIGPRISAHALRFKIDRVESTRGPQDTHWAFKPEQTPVDFDPLLLSVKAAISTVDRRPQGGHTPHITVSYRAPEHLRAMVQIQPVEWIMDEVLFVRGGGTPYHYEVLGRWPLLPPRIQLKSEQAQLF